LFPVITAACDAMYKGTHIDKDIGNLPVQRLMSGDEIVGNISYWDLTSEERIAIAEGALVRLHIMGGLQPPVMLDIDPNLRELKR